MSVRYLLNRKTGDVVPENVELAKRIAKGDFMRISNEEAKRRFESANAPADPELASDPVSEPVPGENPVIREQFDAQMIIANQFRDQDDRDGLDAYALSEFGIKLDKRRNITKMRDEFEQALADHLGLTV